MLSEGVSAEAPLLPAHRAPLNATDPARGFFFSGKVESLVRAVPERAGVSPAQRDAQLVQAVGYLSHERELGRRRTIVCPPSAPVQAERVDFARGAAALGGPILQEDEQHLR